MRIEILDEAVDDLAPMIKVNGHGINVGNVITFPPYSGGMQ